MTVTPSYYYVGKAPSKIKNKISQEKTKTNGDILNPLFNFDKSFTDNLAKVTQLELAQSVPYIRLDIVDFSGKSINNLNVSFFHKQLDFNSISQEERYSDRPTLSLQNIDITISEASGYICYTDVTLRLKIHKKNDLSNRAVLGLLFPGCPLRLEYGWSSPNKEFLDQHQILSMNVINYNISLDKTGQAELVVKCKAFNDSLGAVLIGDLGPEEGKGHLSISYTQVQKFLDYAAALESSKDKNVNDYSIVRASAVKYEARAKIAKGEISKNFNAAVTKLHGKDLILKNTVNNKSGSKQVSFLTFHDIFYTLCHSTLEAMTKIIPVKTFDIVYGSFNKSCYELKDTSIADFQIDFDKFMGFIKEKKVQGVTCITVSELLSELISYATDETYLVKAYSSKDKKNNNPPNIIVNFSNSKDKLTLSIFDVKCNLPITTNELPIGKSSSGEVEKKFTKDFNLPLISLGSANTFIKEISLSQVDDPQMKAVMIARAAQSAYQNPRDPEINANYIDTGPINPLTLPLQGSATMIGHVGWLPQRAFYLSTGLFMVDAVYIISKVSHTLSRDGFETKIDFRWH